jgi:hypothetical protein
MNSKWTSRKLWAAIGGLACVIAVEFLGVGEDVAQNIVNTVTYIVPAYIGGQGIVDALAAYSGNKSS